MFDPEWGAWLRLTLTPGVGNAVARKLLAAFGLPSRVFTQTRHVLLSVVSPKLTDALLQEPADWSATWASTQNWLLADPQRHHMLMLGHDHYPTDLLQTEDPPLVLYALGDIDTLLHPKKVAVVGSRNPTAQGAENAQQFARTLSASGVCVVSGLALGVDGAAHSGALEGGGPTIAVVGTGLDRVYPKKHLALAHRIAGQGVLISEYALGTPPLAPNFPKRNRIISGLSRGTLVIEAALQSGSLITAKLAAEQGREVFAIPGSIHAPQSRGCHALIRQGAKLVESAQDVLEDLHFAPPGTSTPAMPTAPATGSDDEVLEALGFDPVGLDALQARTGLDTAPLQTRLLELELEGHLTRLPGGLFQRSGLA
jgi:DNA processing protein